MTKLLEMNETELLLIHLRRFIFLVDASLLSDKIWTFIVREEYNKTIVASLSKICFACWGPNILWHLHIYWRRRFSFLLVNFLNNKLLLILNVLLYKFVEPLFYSGVCRSEGWCKVQHARWSVPTHAVQYLLLLLTVFLSLPVLVGSSGSRSNLYHFSRALLL